MISIWEIVFWSRKRDGDKNNKPVEFEQRLQSHPALIKLELLFEKLVFWKIVIPKVVLEVGKIYF